MPELTLTLEFLLAIGSVLVAGGAAFGGARSALNGTRKEVKEIKATLADHVKADEDLSREVITRLARVETKLETK